MKRLIGRTLLMAFAVAVGVLTMPIWPVLFATVVWNDLDDDEEDAK